MSELTLLRISELYDSWDDPPSATPVCSKLGDVEIGNPRSSLEV